ncbi:APC family permease [Ampullimonas aquatilis]|uniref:APC family permease n=1 Tax=Ampullimonas aquatilis TaxID=1341549 RepID=UPI003C75FA4D
MMFTKNFLRDVSVSVGMAFTMSCFSVIASLLGLIGSLTPISICLAVVLMAVVASSIGELALRFPSAIGVRTYVKSAFGNRFSLYITFLYLVLTFMVAAIESVLFGSLIKQLFFEVPTILVALILFAGVAWVNVRGLDFSRDTQMIMVVLLFLSVVGMSVLGISQGSYGNWLTDVQQQDTTALPESVLSSFFLFVGIEWITTSQSGGRKAVSMIPRVLYVSVILLALMYALFSLAMIGHFDLPAIAVNNKPQLLLANLVMGRLGSVMVLLVSGLAIMTSFNAGMIGSSRLLYVIAREGYLPKGLLRLHESSGAPITAIAVVTGICILAAMLVDRFNLVLPFANAGAMIICVVYMTFMAVLLKLGKPGNLQVSGLRYKVMLVLRVLVFVMLAATLLMMLADSKSHDEVLVFGVVLACLLPMLLVCNVCAKRQMLAMQ